MLAVWETGFASTLRTPGRLPIAASTTAFSEARNIPLASSTAVVSWLIAGPAVIDSTLAHPGGVYELCCRHELNQVPWLPCQQGAAPHPPSPDSGADRRNRADGRGRALLHRRPHSDQRRPGGARQGLARPARRPHSPLHGRCPRGRPRGQGRGDDGGGRSPVAEPLRAATRGGRG